MKFVAMVDEEKKGVVVGQDPSRKASVRKDTDIGSFECEKIFDVTFCSDAIEQLHKLI